MINDKIKNNNGINDDDCDDGETNKTIVISDDSNNWDHNNENDNDNYENHNTKCHDNNKNNGNKGNNCNPTVKKNHSTFIKDN